MKLCKDCKYCDASGGIHWAKCRHPKSGPINPLTGESDGRYCDFERKWGWFMTRVEPGTCGQKARWFEPKKTS